MSIVRKAITAGLLGASAGAFAQAGPSELSSASIHQLERIYLRCDQLSSRSVLDRGSAIYCSIAAEELCRRGFDGDFGRMIAWWQASRLEPGGGAANEISR